MNALLAVFIGGGLGSLARYLIALYSLRLSSTFPLGTLISNLLACMLLAIFVFVLKDKVQYHALWRIFLISGFCGGFSTFSTFSFENFVLIRNDHIYLAIANILISVLAGLGIMFFLLKDFQLHD